MRDFKTYHPRTRKKPKRRCPATGKVQFREGEAIIASELVGKTDRVKLAHYKCPTCGWFHLTSHSWGKRL